MEDSEGLIQQHRQFKAQLAAAGWKDGGVFLKSGVYFLLQGTEIIYIGKAKCMLVRVYSHLAASNSKRKTPYSAVAGVKFDGLKLLPVPMDRMADVEREMIAKYMPKYNQRLKPPPKQKLSLPPGLVAMIVAKQALVPEGFRRRV